MDNALDEIQKTNPKLKGILNRISQYQLGNEVLTGLINTFSDANFSNPEYNGEKLNLKSKDILGHVYEYFSVSSRWRKANRRPVLHAKSIVTLIIETSSRITAVYDPAMGPAGSSFPATRFIEEHAGEKQYNAAEQKRNISVYGRVEPDHRKLAAMNMAIRVSTLILVKNADTPLDDQHPDREPTLMANPPFNMKSGGMRS